MPCTDQLCIDLHIDLNNPPNMCTPQPQNKCAYEIRYIDGGRSNGVLIRGDKFSLPKASPKLAFGCGHDQDVGPNFQVESPVDGLLGLGRGKLDLVSQLKNQRMITGHVIGHCISIKGGGFLVVGVDKFPSAITWVPMVRSRFGNYYSPGSAKLHFNGTPLRLNPMEVVFDSGSTYTYFAAQPYQATLSAVKNALGDSLKLVPDHALPVCWGGDKPFKSVADVKKFFKSLSLIFQQGHNKATMAIPPENYLIISKDGNVCLGIRDGSRHSLDEMNIIGDVTMQDQIVIYDNERARLGWAHTQCDSMPIAQE